MKAVALLGALVLLGGGSAVAAGIRDMEDAWLLPAAQIQTLLDLTGESPHGGAWGAAGSGRLFGMPDLPQLRIAAGGTVPGASRRLAWVAARESLGGSLVSESRTEAGLVAGRDRRLAILWTRSALVVDGEPEAEFSGVSVALGYDWRGAGGPWCVDLRIPVNQGPDWYGPDGRRSFLRVTAIRDVSRLALTVGVDRRGDGSFAGGAELDLAFGSRLMLGIRSDPSSGAIGPVTAWGAGPLLIRTSHLAHPELGVSHRWELVLGRAGWTGP